jgi:hypothetical protein
MRHTFDNHCCWFVRCPAGGSGGFRNGAVHIWTSAASYALLRALAGAAKDEAIKIVEGDPLRRSSAQHVELVAHGQLFGSICLAAALGGFKELCSRNGATDSADKAPQAGARAGRSVFASGRRFA